MNGWQNEIVGDCELLSKPPSQKLERDRMPVATETFKAYSLYEPMGFVL